MTKRKIYSEQIRWTWQRISGLLLIFGIGVHLFVSHISMSWPIHLRSVNERVSHPFWIVFDCLLLILALFHGFMGIYTVMTDRNPSQTFKAVLQVILIFTGTVLSGLGVWNIIALAR